jgi:hypothetical protein
MDLGLTLDLTEEKLPIISFISAAEMLWTMVVVSSHEFYREAYICLKGYASACDSGMVYFLITSIRCNIRTKWRFEDGSLSTEFEPCRFYDTWGCFPVNRE